MRLAMPAILAGCLAASVVLVGSPTASAQQVEYQMGTDVTQSCKDEKQKHCKEVTNEHEILTCLDQNRTTLSKDCLAKVEDGLRKVLATKVKTDCKTDISRYCGQSDQSGDESGTLRCLGFHGKDLTATCKDDYQRWDARFGSGLPVTTPSGKSPGMSAPPKPPRSSPENRPWHGPGYMR